jgi:hypothetical protein
MAAKYEIDKILLDLAAAFPEFKPDDMSATVAQYADALAVYPVALLEQAAKDCRDSCKYFPHISDIKAAVAVINGRVKDTSLREELRPVPCPPEIREQIHGLIEKWNGGRPYRPRTRSPYDRSRL